MIAQMHNNAYHNGRALGQKYRESESVQQKHFSYLETGIRCRQYRKFNKHRLFGGPKRDSGISTPGKYFSNHFFLSLSCIQWPFE